MNRGRWRNTVAAPFAAAVLMAIGCQKPVPGPNPAAAKLLAEAKASQAAGDWSRALQTLGAARDADAASAEPALAAAELLHRMGLPKDALIALEYAAKKLPKDPAPWVQLSELYDADSMFELSRQAVEKAVALAPKDPAVQIARGRLLLRQNDVKGAVVELEAAVKKAPNHKNIAEALHLLGVLYRRDGHNEAAEKSLRAALEKNPFRLDSVQELAAILADLNRHAESLRLLERTMTRLETGRQQPPASLCYELSRAYMHSEDTASGLKFATAHRERQRAEVELAGHRAALWENGTDPQLRQLLVEALMKDNLSQEAEAVYRGTVQLNPNDPESWNGVAVACMMRQDSACAKNAIERALVVAPDHVPSLVRMVTLLVAEGDKPRAEQLLRRARELEGIAEGDPGAAPAAPAASATP